MIDFAIDFALPAVIYLAAGCSHLVLLDQYENLSGDPNRGRGTKLLVVLAWPLVLAIAAINAWVGDA